jgi:hypothetical protein
MTGRASVSPPLDQHGPVRGGVISRQDRQELAALLDNLGATEVDGVAEAWIVKRLGNA